jgi:alkanesulfonate monooxygenase SsuD/methylene tetrahydromethanopterin reductase-like flavin-dependent oxidoreductase (luciferase family)
MKLGLHLNDFRWPAGASQLGSTLTRVAHMAEAEGFDRISVGDHVWQSPYLGGPEREVLACYPTLAHLGAHTSQINLLALVTAAPYWQPVLLAKTVTTLDVLSGGRAWLGIGAGDYDAIEKTCMFSFDVGEDGSNVGELIGRLRWLASMGIETVLGVVPQVNRIEPLEIIGREVIPAVAGL